MTWQPLQRLPGALERALCDAVRATVLQRDVGRGIERAGDGLLVVPFEGATDLHVSLQCKAQAVIKHGQRQAVRYDFDGRAVLGRDSYGLSAQAILDTKTRAFFDVACVILWKDGAGG